MKHLLGPVLLVVFLIAIGTGLIYWQSAANTNPPSPDGNIKATVQTIEDPIAEPTPIGPAPTAIPFPDLGVHLGPWQEIAVQPGEVDFRDFSRIAVDGNLLAAVAMTNGEQPGSTVVSIDLISGTMQRLTDYGPARILYLFADDRRVVWTEQTSSTTAVGIPAEELHVFDANTNAETVAAKGIFQYVHYKDGVVAWQGVVNQVRGIQGLWQGLGYDLLTNAPFATEARLFADSTAIVDVTVADERWIQLQETQDGSPRLYMATVKRKPSTDSKTVIKGVAEPMSNLHDERTDELVAAYKKHFQADPTHVASGPGRVNLIGEHTDYNDGFVLPVALKRDVRFVFRPRTDRQVRLLAQEFDETFAFDLDRMAYVDEPLWANYVMGMAWSLAESGLQLTGIDAVVSGNVPRGSGLSSSAAVEVGAAHAFLAASNQLDALTGPQIAKAAQRAENQFVGVNCGIMDQFISVLGKENHALLIDCRTLTYELIPMPEEAALVIGNTRASRSLASSAYNERRAQCEQGVAILQTVLPGITALRDVTSAQLEAHKDLLSPVVYQRCRHIVHENERVLATVAAFRAGDLATVGRLMDASHASLRDDYAVSSPALDAMVTAMHQAPGVYGARLTGAGFGGCAVALVQPGAEQGVADAIFEEYPKATNIWPEVYTTRAADGARVEVL